MPFHATEFPGLFLYEPKVFEDNRGYFFESYNEKEFSYANLSYDWVQDNQSKSQYGVIRGLHYQQEPFAQAKLVQGIEWCDLGCGCGYQSWITNIRQDIRC